VRRDEDARFSLDEVDRITLVQVKTFGDMLRQCNAQGLAILPQCRLACRRVVEFHLTEAPMILHDVVSVAPVANYVLRVEFDDGTVGDVDIAHLIEFRGVFAPLLDMDFFRQVTVHPEFGVVCWPNGADMDSDVLYSQVTGVRIGWAENEIFMSMKQLTTDKITIFISHRFSTVRLADRIILLEGGEVIEKGTHEGLLAQAGVYAEIFELQAAA